MSLPDNLNDFFHIEVGKVKFKWKEIKVEKMGEHRSYNITQNGYPLNKSKYSIDPHKRVFSSEEDYLVLDFNCLGGWTFNTGYSCTFKTGHYCKFKTGDCCIFKTGSGCTFKTGSTYRGGDNCTFDTGRDCTFDTGDICTFSTGRDCTFKTGKQCIFSLYNINTCKFKSYDGISIILDRKGNKHYVLSKELIDMLKVKNG